MKKILLALLLLASPAFADGLVVPNVLSSKIVVVSRDLTAASGNVSTTGLGFKPSSCVSFGEVSQSITNYVSVYGFSDSSLASKNSFAANGLIYDNSNFITLADATIANVQSAIIASYDADGFTLTWTKIGAPTGTATINVMCYK